MSNPINRNALGIHQVGEVVKYQGDGSMDQINKTVIERGHVIHQLDSHPELRLTERELKYNTDPAVFERIKSRSLQDLDS